MTVGFLSLLRLVRMWWLPDPLARSNGNNYFIWNRAWLDRGGLAGQWTAAGTRQPALSAPYSTC
jgi:hypothetical protein